MEKHLYTQTIRLLLLLGVLFLSTNLHAQQMQQPEQDLRPAPRAYLQAGFSMQNTTGTTLKKVFNYGTGFSASLPISIYKGRLYAKPIFGSTYFLNYFDTATQDNLLLCHAGLGLNYHPFLSLHRKWDFYPNIEIHYSWGRNFLSPRSGYTGSNVEALKIKGWGGLLGTGFIYRGYFAELGYYIFRPTVTMHDNLSNQYAYPAGLYTPLQFKPTKMNFDYLQLSFGVRFAFN